MSAEYHSEQLLLWSARISAAKQGDRESLQWLLQNYWRPLWEQEQLGPTPQSNWSHLETRDSQDDSGFSIREFQGASPVEFASWLQAISSEHLLAVWRAAGSGVQLLDTKTLDTDVLALNRPALFSSASGNWSECDEEAVVTRIFAIMPERLACVLRLRYWEAMSFEAIGVAMNRSPEAAKQLWYEAIESFAENLEQHDSGQ
jgi:DNA-directed RNA polymerase specialized sigma24 family protein